jgi:hypothetical protein
MSGNAFNGGIEAFVRAANGTITDFDAPGGAGTYLYGINRAGTITGDSWLSGQGASGIVLATGGTLTTFNVPGAGMAENQGTIGYNINASGAIAGYYVDANNVSHGFVRTK